MRMVVIHNGESAYAKRHKSDHVSGPLIPLGALIKAMPSARNEPLVPLLLLQSTDVPALSGPSAEASAEEASFQSLAVSAGESAVASERMALV